MKVTGGQKNCNLVGNVQDFKGDIVKGGGQIGNKKKKGWIRPFVHYVSV